MYLPPTSHPLHPIHVLTTHLSPLSSSIPFMYSSTHLLHSSSSIPFIYLPPTSHPLHPIHVLTTHLSPSPSHSCTYHPPLTLIILHPIHVLIHPPLTLIIFHPILHSLIQLTNYPFFSFLSYSCYSQHFSFTRQHSKTSHYSN